jgi:hypothetical protein
MSDNINVDPIKKYNKKVYSMFFHTAIGVILPSIIAAILLILICKTKYLINFIDNGDLCIYSAALFVSASFLFKENNNSIDNKIDNFLSEFLQYFLVLAAIMYGGIYLLHNLAYNIDKLIKINITYIRVVSILLFILALFSVYRSISLNYKSIFPNIDVEKESKENVNDIMEKLK